MERIDIKISLEQYQELMRCFNNMAFTKENFPETAKAVDKSLSTIQNYWTGYLSGDISLKRIGKINKPMDPSKLHFTRTKRGDFAGDISTNDKKIDDLIEGKKAVDYDMKKTHPYGLKSRVSKKGVPYLIINFRWGTPNEHNEARAHWNNYIPQDQFNTSVKALQLMHITGDQHDEVNARGEPISRNEYANEKGEHKWSKLSKNDAREFSVKKNGKIKKFNNAGLVHMSSGEYFTFRVISAESPADSWLYHRDAVPGVDLLNALKDTLEETITSIIGRGLAADITQLKG